MQLLVVEYFPREVAGFKLPGKVSEGVHLKQSFSLVRTCQNCTLEKTVIEGISYLVNQFRTCTCTSQPCMVKRYDCGCCRDLLIERKRYALSNSFTENQKPLLKK